MSKIFASCFTSILDEIGCEGYGVDVDAVFDAMRRNDPLINTKEHTIIQKQYYDVRLTKWKSTFLKGRYMPTGGIIEALFDLNNDLHFESHASYAEYWYARWVDAHVNLVLNRIYGAQKPLIDNFLLLNDGAFDYMIKVAFGGENHNDADRDFQIALSVDERNKGRKLTEVEIELLKTKYYQRSQDELDALKQRLISEILNEWEQFSALTTDEILNRG